MNEHIYTQISLIFYPISKQKWHAISVPTFKPSQKDPIPQDRHTRTLYIILTDSYLSPNKYPHHLFRHRLLYLPRPPPPRNRSIPLFVHEKIDTAKLISQERGRRGSHRCRKGKNTHFCPLRDRTSLRQSVHKTEVDRSVQDGTHWAQNILSLKQSTQTVMLHHYSQSLQPRNISFFIKKNHSSGCLQLVKGAVYKVGPQTDHPTTLIFCPSRPSQRKDVV